jgi:hypothetical protein
MDINQFMSCKLCSTLHQSKSCNDASNFMAVQGDGDRQWALFWSLSARQGSFLYMGSGCHLKVQWLLVCVFSASKKR